MHAKPRRSRMKTKWFAGRARVAALACALLAIPELGTAADPPAGPIPFRNAVELALQHSGVMGIAAINQWRARKAYEEVRANYIPQITIGSGLGYSYGFPLTLEGSAPSVVNFNSVQSFFNLSLRQFMKAAKIDWHATSLDVQDKRDAVILDTALTYAQLAQLTGKVQALREAQTAAEKAQFVSEQRLQEGVDSKLEVTRSQLVTARIRLRIAEAQDQSDVLATSICRTCWDCPADPDRGRSPIRCRKLPAISQDDDLPARAVETSLAVKSGGAESSRRAGSGQWRAQGGGDAHHRFGVAVRLPGEIQQLRFVLSRTTPPTTSAAV